MMPRLIPRSFLIVSICLLTLLPAAMAQTFRGQMTGTVTDAQGAVVPNAPVKLKNPATNATLDTVSNAAGEFNFPQLPPGTYNLIVTVPGFETKEMDDITIDVSKVTNEVVKLAVGGQNTVVEVNADNQTLDTTASSLVSVVTSQQVQDMPINGGDFTQMLKFTPGDNLSGSVNGQRTTSVNFQIDGTDNIDAWEGIVASNQGGVNSVAGGLVPIDAIDQFSMQSDAEADMGRNAGANQNMVLKSGTNQIHGEVFYYNRNEFFAAISPVAPVDSPKVPIRNNQPGFTLGGPIWKDHTFLFLAGEVQLATAGNSDSDTVLNNAWVTAGQNFLSSYGLTANKLSLALYNTLYPAVANNAGAVLNNWFANAPDRYNSYNSVIKLDHHFNDKETLSMRFLGTTGTQTAVTSSYYPEYFQTAPMHIFNFSVIQDSIISSHLLNQVQLGTNYFLQRFNDADQDFSPGTTDGLALGLTGILAAGSPTISIDGFDEVGVSQPAGRQDVTGQLSDSLQWTKGTHAFKFGGEFRHAQVDLLGLVAETPRGSFTFDGTRGPWSGETSTDNANCMAAFGSECNEQDISLADFLNGEPSNQTTSKLVQGDDERTYLLNSFDFWAQDDYRVTKKLTVNYGVRYSLPGAVYDAKHDLYSFVPGQGFVAQLYKDYFGAFGPRLGFSYAPRANGSMAIRGAFGVFYDVPPMTNMVEGATGNGGDLLTQNNPAGANPAYTLDASNIQWEQNVNPFKGATVPQLGAMGVQPNFRIPYAMNFSLNVEKQFGKSMMATVGYVGAQGRRLVVLRDLNEPIGYNLTTKSYERPYDSDLTFPGQTISTGQPFAGINQVQSAANSNFNSFQAVVRETMSHGFSGTFNYTWAHSLDDASSGVTPMNSYDLKQDYGPSTFDTRQTFTGFVSYKVPKLTNFAPKLTQGYQFNSLFDYNTGTPLSVLIGKDYSLTDENHDRVSIVPGVARYLGKTIQTTSSGARDYNYLSKAAYAYPVAGVSSPTDYGAYGNEQRDGGGYGPKFGDNDFSIFKNTPITEKVNSEFRIEIFNLFNQHNFANPSVSNFTSGTFGAITETKNGAGAPGIGYGEPFNIQFALKLTF
jgi:hypothetical protein